MNYKQLMVRNNIKNKGQRKKFHKYCNYEQIFFYFYCFPHRNVLNMKNCKVGKKFTLKTLVKRLKVKI